MFSCQINQQITDFLNENDDSSRSVVVIGVRICQTYTMHHWAQ